MGVDLVLLANGTACDEVLHEGGETWPPEIMFQNGFSMKDTHVARERGRMDRIKESRPGGRGNKHVIAEIKVAIVKQPV